MEFVLLGALGASAVQFCGYTGFDSRFTIHGFRAFICGGPILSLQLEAGMMK
jgi:hypothetical protein